MGGRRPALILVAAVLAACSAPSSPGGSPASQRTLTVLAASSLQAAFSAATTAFGTSDPKTSVTFGFDASSALRTKIEQGAPADVFASADVVNAQKLVDDGFAIGPPTPFAANRLAIVVPVDNPAHIQTPADLARPGLRLVGAAKGVPISTYATQLLSRLGQQRGYPPGFADAVAENTASQEDNVAAVVAKVALGEADGGIVYQTDALASPKLKVIPLPAGVKVAVTYAAVVVRASTEPDAARAFLDWLTGPNGQAVLARFGFASP